MPQIRMLPIFLIALFFTLNINAENDKIHEPKFEFGKVSAQDFNLSSWTFDTTAEAVIIINNGTSIIGDPEQRVGEFKHKITKRIKILSESGKKLANNSINLWGSSFINNFTGYTHKLENGEIKSYKIDKKDNFYNKVNDNLGVIKFTLPNVTVGSIIEIEYDYISNLSYYVPDWYFQEDYPVLWSSYELIHPESVHYFALPQTAIPFTLATTSKKENDYMARYQYFGKTVTNKWAMKDLPAFNSESLTYNPRYYQSSLSFERAIPNFNNWEATCKYTMGSLYWYKPFYGRHKFFNRLVPKVKGESKEDFAKRIYYTIRDRTKCIRTESIKPKHTPGEIADAKKTNSTDLNLFLMSCYKHYGFEATPLLVNTRNNGKPITGAPIRKRLNRTICYLKINDTEYFLDASRPYYKFNFLPKSCYNGFAHVIDKEHKVINLSANKIKEFSNSTAHYTLDIKKEKLLCKVTEELGEFSSVILGKKLKQKNTNEIQKSYTQNINESAILDSFSVSRMASDTFLYKINAQWIFDIEGSSDRYYIKLSMNQNDKELNTALQAEKRNLPIEFPYGLYTINTSQLEVPDGYQVDELPESAMIEIDKDRASFNYIVEQEEGIITIRTILKLNKALFLPSEFQDLKKFFAFVNNLEQNNIVLSKK